LILYQTEDGRTRLEVRLQGETVWLTQAQLAELFQRERSVITKHIRNFFEGGELVESAICANHAQTAAGGKTYDFLKLSAHELLDHAGMTSADLLANLLPTVGTRLITAALTWLAHSMGCAVRPVLAQCRESCDEIP
jgi:hypothetical protein